MKKLMTMIATVAMAFGLYADGLKNTVGFENGAYTAGSKIDVTKGDDGETTQAPVWSATDPTETGTVTEYGTDTKYDYGTQPVIVTDGPGNQFLALETAGLFRNITAGATASGLANGDVFFDTLVKLSATDGLSVPELSNDAKIAIWAGTDEDNDPGVTNLYVTAAAGATGEAKPEAANFTISVGDDFDFDAWHRITVRSLVANTDDAKVAGFVVFVDGVQVACSDEDYADKLGEGLTLTTEAAKFAAQKQLFIGLVYGKDATMLTALGFSGTGAADDVAITDAANAPQFAKGEKVFTLTWDKDAFVSITAGGVDQTVEDGKADITLDGSTTELAVSGVVKTGYKLIGLTAKEGCTADNENGKFTGIVGAAAGSIDAKKVYFTVNGVDCTTLTEAFTEAAKTAGSTITLAGDYSVEKEEQTIAEGADIILDLAGNNMEFTALENEGDVFDVVFGGKLTIIDSVGGGEISIDGEEDAEDIVIAYAEGTLVIGGDTDKGATFTGKLCAPETQDLTIIGGNFDKVNNGVKAFDYTIDTDKYEAVDTVKTGYWTVQEKQAKNFIIEIVGGDKYESIADALAAAENDDTLKLLKDITLTETVEINKAITFDLDNFEIKVANGTYGYAAILITKSGATIKNGKVTSTATEEVASCFINFCEASGTLKDLTVNTTNFKWGVGGDLGETGDWETEYNTYTVACENVDVTGSTSVFCAEGVNLTLDADCSATQAGTHAQDWRNCAIHAGLNAIVTIAGGEYTGAYAIYKMSSPAKIYVNGGKFTGNVYMHPLQGYEGEDVLEIAAGNFDDNTIDTKYLVNNVDAGYERAWVTGDYDGYYKPGAKAITYNITYTFTGVDDADKGKIVNPNASTTTYTIESETITFEDASCDGYEFKGFAPAAITQGSTGDKEIVGTFEKKQQGWPDNPQTVEGQSAGVALGITGKLAGADACKLSTWAKDFNVTFNVDVDQYENAFLLNCNPAEVEDAEKAFKFTAITPGETPTTTKQYKGRDYNGTVQITAYEDVGFTKPVDNPTGTEAKLFYKAELILVPVNK